MKALYLYFEGTATQDRRPSPASAGGRPGSGRPVSEPPTIDQGPLVPIQPGAFSRWMADRNRVVAEKALALRSPLVARPSHGSQTAEATG